jgi:unsaturated rhamnogalacturonyl hydrolase
MANYLKHNLNCINLVTVVLIFGLFNSINYSLENSTKSFSATPWSVRMAESEMIRHKNNYGFWGYVTGTVLKSMEGVWRATNNFNYYKYIQSTIDASVTNSGVISFYSPVNYSLDDINEGRILLLMYSETKSNKYKIAADTLRKQLKNQPRTSDGGFWHRNNVAAGAYPHQMWLDGIYMANPFYAEYGKMFNEPADYDDVFTQLSIMEKYARDSITGLLYHGWDESRTQAWANPITGCSPSFWGRAIGWYAMAAIDILDYLPGNYAKRKDAIQIVARLAAALKKYQDPTKGTWYQVVDQVKGNGNWRESSASCMFVYTLAKAVRLNYIDKSYLDVAKKGYTGILEEFITTNTDSTINLTQICSVAGLGLSGGVYRDGSYDYYVNQTTRASNDGKATGPFIMASLEMEKTGAIIPPMNVIAKLNGNNFVTISWNDKSYNAKGFVIYRKISGETDYKEIGKTNKGENTFTDANLSGVKNCSYKLSAYNDLSFSDFSNEASVVITSIEEKDGIDYGFMLHQNFPNPFNPNTIIKYRVAEENHVSLKVYDLLGREVATLVDEIRRPGFYTSQFSISKLDFPSGVYFYKIQSGKYSSTKKMILSK